MPKPLLLCDLDRTLFDTDIFVRDVWAFAGSLYGFRHEKEKGRQEEFYDYYGDMYDYRFFDHLAAAVGPDFDRDVFVESSSRVLTGKYVYPDITDDVVRDIDAIVTFGGADYQKFKLLLSPSLANIECHVILEPKGGYVHKTFQVPYVLVDDKPLAREIVPLAQFIQINRSSQTGDKSERTIRDFSELPALLRIIGAN